MENLGLFLYKKSSSNMGKLKENSRSVFNFNKKETINNLLSYTGTVLQVWKNKTKSVKFFVVFQDYSERTPIYNFS